MSWYLLLKLAHIACVVAMLSGVIGRSIVRAYTPREESLATLRVLIQLIGRFDELLVIRGSQLTLVTGLLLGWVGGWPYITANHPTWIFISLALFLSIIPLVIFIFVPRGKVFEKALQSAIQEQHITPALRQALADPLVRAATVYEVVLFSAIIALMVFKPF